ncbi:hypothetical protein HELRODRAFT_86113 [Helobdella robusta]|uniref:Uncharacterized protein n=1 Tax=Helobdella robusta TaxID=6412 RepID=T1G676_HELRO|nr:hypothetical protein HELRODRAFT_86113 [Helobdella robusta]ESN96857.1 hypothetical protein HELRODRAFT_86113 [Helobdella robusta]
MPKLSETAAIQACKNGDVLKLQWCKEKFGPAVLEKKNQIGKSPLHEAVVHCKLQCVEYLLEENVDVNSLKRGDWTPLMLACTKNELKIVERLVEHGSNLQLVNKDGWNCLHLAVRENNVEIVKYLLNCNPMLAANQTRNKRTPLHTACLHGHLEVLELLLNRCSYAGDMVDSCGTTAFMDALRFNHVPVANLLFTRCQVSCVHHLLYPNNIFFFVILLDY